MKRVFAAGFALFLLSATVGYLEESSGSQPARFLNRGEMGAIVASALHTLQPLIRESEWPSPIRFVDQSVFSGELLGVAAGAGIMKGFPDSTFRADLKVTRGECLEIFSSMLDFLKKNLIRPQETLKCATVFQDVTKNHWLEAPLSKLVGVGALSVNGMKRMEPDAAMSAVEAKNIASRLIGYFQNELLGINVNGDGVTVISKGTLTALPIQDWKYSWNSDDWRGISFDGKISFPLERTPRKELKLLLAHPQFNTIVIPDVRFEAGTLWFFKLTRHIRPVREIQGISSKFLPNFPERVSRSSSETGEGKGDSREEWELQLRGPKPIISAPVPRIPEKGPKSPPRAVRNIPITEMYPDDTQDALASNRSGEAASSARCSTMGDIPRNGNMKDEAAEAKEVDDEEWMVQSSKDDSDNRPKNSAEEFTPEDLPVSGGLSGKVIDSLTGQGVPGATVLVGSHNFETDLSGRFRLYAIPPGIQDFTVYCEGYDTLFLRRRVGNGEKSLVFRVNERRASIEGHVLDAESGRPVSNASLKIAGRTIRSDSDGSFTISSVPPTYHQMTCQAPDFMDTMEVLYVQSPITRKDIRIQPIKPMKKTLRQQPPPD